mmetsp:Transcript_26877/g.52640  ORF Transcript_26877/g.52640 Transcript_26877/m.52640 type:complete len:262 (-) Transcript_26877:4-789(-)
MCSMRMDIDCRTCTFSALGDASVRNTQANASKSVCFRKISAKGLPWRSPHTSHSVVFRIASTSRGTSFCMFLSWPKHAYSTRHRIAPSRLSSASSEHPGGGATVGATDIVAVGFASITGTLFAAGSNSLEVGSTVSCISSIGKDASATKASPERARSTGPASQVTADGHASTACTAEGSTAVSLVAAVVSVATTTSGTVATAELDSCPSSADIVTNTSAASRAAVRPLEASHGAATLAEGKPDSSGDTAATAMPGQPDSAA